VFGQIGRFAPKDASDRSPAIPHGPAYNQGLSLNPDPALSRLNPSDMCGASGVSAQVANHLPGEIAARPGRRVIIVATGLAAFALASLSHPAPIVAAERFAARVEHVPDGDSITVRTDDGRRLKIRLAGIDAPELGQPHAQAARDHLRTRILSNTVEIQPFKTDIYGRLVARVLHEREDLALLQVSSGHAWHFERYASDQTPFEQQLYRAAQQAARGRRLGLWQSPDPVPPWDYRSAERRR